VVAISARYNHVAAVLRGGELVCWGNNGAKQCNVPANLLARVPAAADCDTELQYQFQQLTTLKQFVESLRRRLRKGASEPELQYQYQQLTALKQFVVTLRRSLQQEVAMKNKLGSAR
jgi:hypothetical protein